MTHPNPIDDLITAAIAVRGAREAYLASEAEWQAVAIAEPTLRNYECHQARLGARRALLDRIRDLERAYHELASIYPARRYA